VCCIRERAGAVAHDIVFHYVADGSWAPPEGPAHRYAEARDLVDRLGSAVDVARAELVAATRSARVLAAHRQGGNPDLRGWSA
jgi:hypothetical protein